jgi:hypothetical protein
MIILTDGMKKIKIEDNFLEQEKFDEIHSIINPMVDINPANPSHNFAWYFRYNYYTSGFSYATDPSDPSYIGFKDEDEILDRFQFTHTFYDEGAPQSPYMKQLECFVELLQPVVIHRIRANLLTRLPNIVENPFHTDMAFLLEEKLEQWTTSIFYVNTNNGYTLFEDGTKVESVANRMLTFPANLKHTGTTCTDQQTRIVINFNYYKNTI